MAMIRAFLGLVCLFVAKAGSEVPAVPSVEDNVSACTFDAPPRTTWMWDTTCRRGHFGCVADGIHVACRYCGEPPYVPCPENPVLVEQDAPEDMEECTFEVAPKTQWMWDPDCTEGDLGCNADNIHVECRWCGEGPYVDCPKSEQEPLQVQDVLSNCTFTNPPKIAAMWDPSCSHGEKGCNADGIHVECRFCGEEPYVPCPDSDVSVERCEFRDTPKTNWLWDPLCKEGDLGCKADGVHTECRFCGVEPYVPCPTCEFSVEPEIPYVWDSKCEPLVYTKGCYADATNFQCRFCGAESFDPCPTTTVTSTTVTTTSPAPSDFDTPSSHSNTASAHDVAPSNPASSLRGGEGAEGSHSSYSTRSQSWTLLMLVGVASAVL